MRLSTLAFGALAVIGGGAVVAGAAGGPGATGVGSNATTASGATGADRAGSAPRVVEAEVREVARQLRPLTFATGRHVEERLSNHVDIPPGVTFRFANLPPGLNFNPATTAIHGTPTTPGVWNVTATAYLAGIPVETATSRVTITGAPVAGAPAPAPGGGAPAPGPAPAPAPVIDPVVVDTLPLPPEARQALRDFITGLNTGVANFWAALPAGSVGP